MKTKLITALLLLMAAIANGQSCSEVSNNILCADTPGIQDSLVVNPLGYSCFNSQMTFYAMFTTGSLDDGFVNITVTPGDCDDFTGPNQINTIVVQIPAGGSPCNPLSFSTPSACQGSETAYTQTVNNLSANTDYVVIVGSDHLSQYGPCEFMMSISGSAVDIGTTVDPFLVYLGGSAQLGAYNADTYEWSPVDYLDDPFIQNPVSTPEETTVYTVSGTVGTCDVSGEATVTVGPPVVIYTGLTPNGDGINDEWVIQGVERFDSAVITVYDRWGQPVFKSTGYAQPWDGTNKGKSLPMGAYYYVIELNSLAVEIEPLTGVVSILK